MRSHWVNKLHSSYSPLASGDMAHESYRSVPLSVNVCTGQNWNLGTPDFWAVLLTTTATKKAENTLNTKNKTSKCIFFSIFRF